MNKEEPTGFSIKSTVGTQFVFIIKRKILGIRRLIIIKLISPNLIENS